MKYRLDYNSRDNMWLPRGGGWGWGPLFFSSLLPPRVGGWVAPHIAVVTMRTFALPAPPTKKRGKSLIFFMWKLHVQMGGCPVPPSTSMPGWLRCKKGFHDSHLEHVVHMFRVFPDHVFFQLSSHIISETDRTKHMAAWSDPRKKKKKKSFKKADPRCHSMR